LLKKRLIGVVTVKDGWAVQSFGYRRYLPLGKPEWLVENLDRWGADEILVLCIDRSSRMVGPDFTLLEKLGGMGLGTPVIYGGGISSVEDGLKVIQAGADRIALDSLLHDSLRVLDELGQQLGLQALVASVPLRWQDDGVKWHDYRKRRDLALTVLARVLERGVVSELLVIDCAHEGQAAGFDAGLLDALPDLNMPVLAFGGISRVEQMRSLLTRPGVAAVCIGNFLSYHELAFQQIKKTLASSELRPAMYASD
jgi:imidazole glycerol-phosphate synthase subunit HisF